MRRASASDLLFDTHCHLNHPRLLQQLPAVVDRARGAGVSRMMVVGYDLPSSRRAAGIAAETTGVWSAVGVHPHEAEGLEHGDLAELRALAALGGVAAIGETGLDFYRNLSSREAQHRAFERHLDLAEELGLPLILHCRSAQDEILAVIAARHPSSVIWHAFDGSEAHARRAADLGLLCGFGGLLTRKGGEGLRQVVRALPADRILLETDSPYLLPRSASGRDNEPANLPMIAQIVAEERGEAVTKVAETTSRNACRIFRLCEHS